MSAYLGIPKPGRRTLTTTLVNDFDADAAARGWLLNSLSAWPPPTQWQQDRSLVYEQILVFSGVSPNETTHQLQLERVGWPWAVAERVQAWWPEDQASPAGIAVGGRWVILWPLLLVAAALCGASVMAAIGVPVILIRRIVRASRLRRFRCPSCGYPLGSSTQCSECGAPLGSAA